MQGLNWIGNTWKLNSKVVVDGGLCQNMKLRLTDLFKAKYAQLTKTKIRGDLIGLT